MNYEKLTEKVRFPTRITTLGAEGTRAGVYEPVLWHFVLDVLLANQWVHLC